MPLEVVVELQIRAVREIDERPLFAPNHTLSSGFLLPVFFTTPRHTHTIN